MGLRKILAILSIASGKLHVTLYELAVVEPCGETTNQRARLPNMVHITCEDVKANQCRDSQQIIDPKAVMQGAASTISSLIRGQSLLGIVSIIFFMGPSAMILLSMSRHSCRPCESQEAQAKVQLRRTVSTRSFQLL